MISVVKVSQCGFHLRDSGLGGYLRFARVHRVALHNGHLYLRHLGRPLLPHPHGVLEREDILRKSGGRVKRRPCF